MSRYLRPAAEARAEVRDRGSRFFAFVAPVASVEAAEARVDELRREYHDATHVVFAFRLGDPARERSSDAGEPAGSAGRPILALLRGAGLSDVVAAVVRYFGGTKLGRGGLARAYAAAVSSALEGLPTEAVVPRVRLRLDFAYEQEAALRRLLAPPFVRIESSTYGARIEWILRVDSDRLEAVLGVLARLGVDSSATEGVS